MGLVWSAFCDGFARVLRAPAVLAGVFVLTVLVALPASHLVQADIEASLGDSLVGAQMNRGVDFEWWSLYLETASGLGRTFTPGNIGFAAVIENLNRVLDGGSMAPAASALVALYLLLWLFLAGGIIDRLARQRAVRAAAFFAACGAFFWRFLRLGVIAGLGFWVLMGPLHGWLFDTVYAGATANMTVERTAFVIRVVLYLVYVGLLAAWTLVMDYSKVRAVVEDRRSMLGALFAGTRFVVKHPKKTGLLWLANDLALLIVWSAYAVAAPGAVDPAGLAWTTFAIGQVYVVARLFLKLLTWASETALFQSMLAHSAYTAAPLPTWPESPEVEAITSTGA
jgi:hypothetical protein